MSSDDLCACGPVMYPGTDAPLEECPVHGGSPELVPFAPAAVREATDPHVCSAICTHGSGGQLDTHDDPYRNTRPAPARQVSVTDTIENVLREHVLVEPSVDWVMCMGCDWEYWKGDDDPTEVHRKHQAVVIAQRLEAK